MAESLVPWVTVRAFTSVVEAQFAGSALEAAGLDVRLGDDHLVSLQWMYSNAVGGVKLQVRADRLDEARQILDLPAEVDDPRAIIDPREACPRCGSSDVASGAWGRRRGRRCKGCGLPLTS